VGNRIEIHCHTSVALARTSTSRTSSARRGGMRARPVITAHPRGYGGSIRKARAEPVEIGVVGDVDVIRVAPGSLQKACSFERLPIRHEIRMLRGPICGREV